MRRGSSVRSIIFLPHANIQYSQLKPERREWVVRNSYDRLFDLVDAGPYRISFEASGETVDFIASHAPDVMRKLVRLIKEGKIEPVGSPYTHLMISNIEPEICLETLKDGLEAWERCAGVRPTVGWNPECAWASYVPDIYKEAGFETLIMDGDSFLLSFPEVREATGLKFDVAGHSNKNHLFRIEEFIADKPQLLRFLTNPSRASNGLNLVFRSDMMSNFMLWYLMGATEGHRDKPIAPEEVRDVLQRWARRVDETGTFILPYAEDAEYIGTTAYFYVKQFGLSRFFEPEEGSVGRFQEMLDMAKGEGFALTTVSDAISNANTIIENDLIHNIENGVAWHGGTAKAWANTEYSRLMDPVCQSIFWGIKAVASAAGMAVTDLRGDLKTALRKVTSAYISDSRWPPAPTSPGRFNVRESIRDLYEANDALGAAMNMLGLSSRKSLYSQDLMQTQIALIERQLEEKSYFGEDRII